MALDSWQKVGISGLGTLCIGIACLTGVQMGKAGSTDAKKPQIQVHVTGAVKRPGVVKIAEDARVKDALEAAGGVRAGAELDGLNLAEALVDGSQVDIVSGLDVDGIIASASTVRHPEKSERAMASASAERAVPSGLVALNTADATELDRLPGVGPATAQKILAYRQANGPFRSVDELLQVKGIGPKKLADIRPHVKL